MRHFVLWTAGAATLAAGICYAAPAGTGRPVARYQMDVSTSSGFGAGGVNPMKMMMGGGGNSIARTLVLRLGSTLAANGAPNADHFLPAGMNMGPSVPLVTPQVTRREEPGEFKRPKGRLLIFWGCGAHVGPGQPVVLDFAKLAQGQFPPGLFSVTVPSDPGPTFANSRTYGEWPNGKSKATAKPTSSLIGDHRIAGNYSPEIKFALDQDFMAGLNARTQAQGDGSQLLSWGSIPNATGYYAWLFGAKDMGNESADMVWWTSANAKEFGGGLTEWLPPATVANLITRKVVMPPTQTSCQIPAEVKDATGGFMMTSLYAYGPQRDFAYPPRPANPKTPWSPEWTAKVRYRSTTMVMAGMPGMDAADNNGGRGNNAGEGEQPKKCKPRITLGGFKPC